MDSSIPFGDLIVLGAVAAFIILRYRAMLGESRGRDAEDIKKSRSEDMAEAPVVRASSRVAEPKPESNPGVKERVPHTISENEAVISGLNQIAASDPRFDALEFLEGAKAAFDMVIDAFNTRDRETLSMLLTENVYRDFDRVLDAQAASSRHASTTLVAMRKAEITNARTTAIGGVMHAEITVVFETSQIHLTKDSAGTVVEGDASREETVRDDWVFIRPIKSTTPDWKISET